MDTPTPPTIDTPKDPLGDRMKRYELACRPTLPPRMPIILRVDGKAFHTYTKGLARPFDAGFVEAMKQTAVALCEQIDGAQIAFVQSDEISVLLHNYKRHATQPWFRNETQKMVSVAASIAGVEMTMQSTAVFGGEMRRAYFDGRVAVYPEAEVNNYFIWRQQDATRNSILMLGQSLYSPSQMHGKNTSQVQEMTWAKGHNWNDLPVHLRRGMCIVRESYPFGDTLRTRWVADTQPPIFSRNPTYVEAHLAVQPEPERAAPAPS